MNGLLVLGAIAFVILFWVMRTRAARRKWVDDLDLIGQWDLEGSDGNKTSIEFIGVRGDAGNYMASTKDSLESGSWSLTSYHIVLEPEGNDAQRYELRFFSKGRIGLHGKGRERQVYRKRRAPKIVKITEHQTKSP